MCRKAGRSIDAGEHTQAHHGLLHGGAGIHYWGPIAERYGLNLTVVNEAVDPTFRCMTVDWDGQIRMDPSSPYAMQRLIDIRDRFEIAWACERILTIPTRAPGNGAPIGEFKAAAESGWFAARPSGTEDICKIYAESFRGADHLRRIPEEAQAIVSDALVASPDPTPKA